MKILIDTHYLIWILNQPEKIDEDKKSILTSSKNEIYVSSVNFWEIALKLSINKISIKNISIDDILDFSLKSNLIFINLTPRESILFHKLPVTEHKDPFDRMLIWQAVYNDFYFLTQDNKIKELYKGFGLKII